MLNIQTDPNGVRLAALQDEDELFEIASNLHKENAIYPMEPAKVRAEIRASLVGSNDPQGIIGVVGKDKIEGAAWLIFMADWYTSFIGINERFIHVLPQYRKSNHAANLIAWMLRVQENCGVPVHTGIFSSERTESKVRFYRRKLGQPVGAFWLIGARTGMNGQ